MHTTTSPDAAALRRVIKGVLRFLTWSLSIAMFTGGTMVKLCPWFIVILMLLLFCRTRVTMIMCFPYDVAAPSLSQGCASEQLFSGTSRKVQLYVGGPDVGLDFTDQPAPAPDIPPQPSAAGEEVDYPGYEDPHGDMPVDGEDTPPPQGQQPEPDLDDDPTELDTGGDPPSQPPEAALRCRYREVNTMTQICICFTCHRQMNRRFRVSSS